MRILIVEDNQDRIQWFLDNFKGNSVTVCMDAVGAGKEVVESKWDLIIYYHDLTPFFFSFLSEISKLFFKSMS